MTNSTGTGPDVNWMYEDYFELLLKADGEEYGYALELMVDDLHKKKEKTVNRFMCHQKVDGLLFALLRLLNNENLRVAGNTAYILGCLAESELGCYRLLSTVTSNKNFQVLQALVKMLAVSDGETVMNAAGTIGTMAESKEGRDWILDEACLSDLVNYCSGLLESDNLWTGSNAALVLARLAISDQGCVKLACQPDAGSLLGRLCRALGTDDAGRGMNAAFALGRLVDTAAGADLLACQQAAGDLSQLVRDLADMTAGAAGDAGSAKNACFCLSCLAGSDFGHRLVLDDPKLAARLLAGLVALLTGPDEETAWFAALAIRIISSKPRGAKFMKGQPTAVETLKSVLNDPEVSPDLKDEVSNALQFLRPLDKPFPPIVEVRGCHELGVRWLAADIKTGGFPVSYELHCDQGLIYSGQGTEYSLTELQPATMYALRVRVCTEADKSSFSEAIVASTEEAAPSKPTNLRLLAATATQLKVSWDVPARGSVRTYIVHCDGRQVDCTTELTSIISGLAPCTQYSVQVCASSSKGKSERATIEATTLDLGAHAPPKPQVTVLGRHEMTVTWEPPEQPLGRINHYNVVLNGKKVVYTGTDMSCKISPLTADTEYSVTVIVVTNEGKAESKPAKKRTAKDEFDPQRQPLWFPSRRYSQASLLPDGANKMAPADAGTDGDNRRGSLAKMEPRTGSKPSSKSEQPPPVRRRSLPPPVESRAVVKEPPSRETRQYSSLAPTTLVLDRFGDGAGGLRRLAAAASSSKDDSNNGVPSDTMTTGGQQTQPQPSVAVTPATAQSSNFAAAAASVVASAAAPRLATSLALFQTSAPRSNARPELEPLPAIGDASPPPPDKDKDAVGRRQQQQQQQQRKQKPRHPNRRSKEPLWLQSRSLVSKQSKDSAGDLDETMDGQQQDGAGSRALLSLNARSSTDRFKTNLAILNSKSSALAGAPQASQQQQHQQQPQPASTRSTAVRMDTWQREATAAQPVVAGGGRFNNRPGPLVRLDGVSRERSSAMPARSLDFPLK